MLGAIIGDIVGSCFEFDNHRSKDFNLFVQDSRFTDDTVMTLAVAKAILSCNGNWDNLGEQAVIWMRRIGRKYCYNDYGWNFRGWLRDDWKGPYESYGNGAAMRVSPCGFIASTEDEAKLLSRKVTEVTHNHDEGIKGAEATTVAIFMAKSGATKKEIRKQIVHDYYSLNFTLDGIHETYQFNETCQETVPQAIVAFLESITFEDCIRNAISIGGDSDTLAAIACAIAEAYYGIPRNLKEKALSYVETEPELFEIYREWVVHYPVIQEDHRIITKYIEKIRADSLGEWIIDRENDGTKDHPKHIPYVNYNDIIKEFMAEFYRYSDAHLEYKLNCYSEILEQNGLKWSDKEMRSADLQNLDAQGILALIMGVIRAERFNDGVLLSFLKDGSLTNWLIRLREIDRSM